MNDLIRQRSADLLDELRTYTGERVTGAHPIFRAYHRLRKAYGGRVPGVFYKHWLDFLDGEKPSEALEEMKYWLRSAAGAYATPEPSDLALNDPEPGDYQHGDILGYVVER